MMGKGVPGGTSHRQLLLFEYHRENGVLEQTWLVTEGSALFVTSEGTRSALPSGALQAVFGRYGRPLNEPIEPLEAPLELTANARVSRVRYRPRYDVIAKDYLVFEQDDREAVCELASTIAAALLHLARAEAARTEG